MTITWRSVAPLVTAIAFGVAAASHAANQQYQGSLIIESHGNDLLPAGVFFVYGMPQGVQCNPLRPVCPSMSTPVVLTMSGKLAFDPLGSFCTAFSYFGATTRPAKGASTLMANVHYRNPGFFTPGGSPNATSCAATTTIGGAIATTFLTTNSSKRGKVMKGAPLTGEQIVTLTGSGPAGFKLKAAPTQPVKVPGPTGFGLRRTTSGEFNAKFPYVYSYTYATLRNDAGSFFAGGGPGSFAVKYTLGYLTTVAAVKVKGGPAKFGGVMRLLGKLATKRCYFIYGGCSLGGDNWRYDAIGAPAYTATGYVTKGYVAKYTAMNYNTALMTFSTVFVSGARFPWTTGTVTVSAKLPDFATTFVARMGYDARTALGKGTLQLVTPVLTHWIHPGFVTETGGVGVMRLEFVPEPEKWLLLAIGLATLGILYQVRRRER